MTKLIDKESKDLTFLAVILAGVLLLVVKLVLSGAQQVFLWPDEAVLDDMVMYDGAVSISNGEWLGAYGWKTLSKHSFFSLWLAGLHTLGIPYLLGGQLLWAAAALAGAWALAPVFGRRWPALALFAVLLFSPASTANPSPSGYIARVYRDNIFPALCLFCIAGMVGYALRYEKRLRRSAGWLVLAGLAFAACRLCREDGWWLAPFVAGAALVTLVFILRSPKLRGNPRAKVVRSALLLLPLLLLLGGEAAWRGANNAAYGRFILSDFAEGEFADAYGAMTRIEHENWHPKIDVPRDVRQVLYEKVPEFAPLQALLESDWYLSRYAGKLGDYDSGSFYWALREAAAELGHYDTPEAAKTYFEGLAASINTLCDSGEIAAGPQRSSVNPPVRAEYVAPVLREAAYSLYFCATFQQCDAHSLYSPASDDAYFYALKIAPMEDFLHEKAHTVTQTDSNAPSFTLWQRICFKALDAIRFVYALALPVMLLGALCQQVWVGVRLVRRKKVPASEKGENAMLWWVMLGILCCILLRALMIAFVMVASFNIPTYVMYLASIHPLMLIYGFVGTHGFLNALWRRRVRHAANAAA